MMRVMGILMMAFSITAGGFLEAERYEERLELLIFLEKMFLFLKNAVLKGNEPLSDAISDTGKRFLTEAEGVRKRGPEFFLSVFQRLQKEESLMFQKIWEEEAGRYFDRTVMKEEDRQILFQLGRQLGHADREMQEKAFEFCFSQMDDAIRTAREEKKTKVRLCRSLGAAAGIFLLILLI